MLPRPDPLSDSDLVVRARGGDRAAWGELYARYADRLFDYAARLTGSRAQAADCVQDAFILAVERVGQLRDPDKVRPWLYAIVRSTAHRHYRRANRFSMQDVPEIATGDDDVMVQGVTDHELAGLLEEAARGLSDEDREVLDLSLRHDLSAADVAAALGVSTRHASVTTERMRERLGRSVIVTVLSRRPECDEFAAIQRAEGELTPLSRKRLARHVDSCDVCAKQRDRQVRPEALLGVLPLLLIPKRAFADFEEGLEAAMRRAASGAVLTDGGLEWDDHGFPVVRHARRPRWLPWVAASLVGLLIGGGLVGLAVRDDAHGSTTLAAGVTTVITVVPIEVATTLGTTDLATSPVASSPVDTLPSSTSVVPGSVETVDRPLGPTSVPGSGPMPTVAPDTTVPAAPVIVTRPTTPTSRPPSTQPAATTPPPPTSPAQTAPPATSPPGTTPPATVATTLPPPTTMLAPTTTTTAPDTMAPAIGTPTAVTTNISATWSGGAICNAYPATTTSFSLTVSDPSGIASVKYTWSAGTATGGAGMSASGSTWTGTLGPVDSSMVTPATPSQESQTPMSVTITAKDNAGNTSVLTRSGVVIVHSCYIIL